MRRESASLMRVQFARAVAAKGDVTAPGQQFKGDLERIRVSTISDERLIRVLPAIAIGTVINAAAIELVETTAGRQDIRASRGEQENAGLDRAAAGPVNFESVVVTGGADHGLVAHFDRG